MTKANGGISHQYFRQACTKVLACTGSAVKISTIVSALLTTCIAIPAKSIEQVSLIGITYYQRQENRGENGLNRGVWEGLPSGTELTYGSLLVSEQDPRIELPQQFGYQGMRIGSQTFVTFELISNFNDGHTFNRILGAIETTGTSTFAPCLVKGSDDPEVIAILTPNELKEVIRQSPSRMDGIAAVVRAPQRVFRLNRRTMKIEQVDSSMITCKGWPND
jgi:hypothetical protein